MKNQKRKRKPNARKNKLTAFEFLEMSEYTHDELVELFTLAIHDMSGKGILSPMETKEYLHNLKTWLRELLDQ